VPATKDQIADTFEKHVQRFGFARSSVEDVAAELGISKRTVYQHFGSKKELYGYVVDRIADAECSRLEQLIAAEPTWRAKMQRFLRIVVQSMRLHIQETSKSDWMQEFEIAYDAMAGAYGAIGTRLARGGFEAGEFEFADEELANGFIGAIVTHYGLVVRDKREYDADEAVVAAIMRMLGGAPGAALESKE
jgi:AcrR family transcriptional regulator